MALYSLRALYFMWRHPVVGSVHDYSSDADHKAMTISA